MPSVQRAGHDDLPFGDVAGQVGNRVGLVVFGHRQDRHQGDGALLALDAAGALVDRRQVGVQVAGIAAPAGHFLAGGGDLAQRLAVVGHVGQDDQHVHVQLEGQVLGGGQGHARRGDALDGRVVGQVDEQDRALDGARCARKSLMKKSASSKVMPMAANTTANVSPACSTLAWRAIWAASRGVRQTGAGEDRQLLAAHQRVEPVDGGDAGLDELVREIAGVRVDRGAVDVEHLLRDDLRAAVDGPPDAVEDPAEHVRRDAQLQPLAQESHAWYPATSMPRGAFKDLHQRRVARRPPAPGRGGASPLGVLISTSSP